jgi:hypothetical protein
LGLRHGFARLAHWDAVTSFWALILQRYKSEQVGFYHLTWKYTTGSVKSVSLVSTSSRELPRDQKNSRVMAQANGRSRVIPREKE